MTEAQSISADNPSQNGAGILFNGDGDTGDEDYQLFKDTTPLNIDSGQYSVTEYTNSENDPPNQVTISEGLNDDAVNTNPANGELIDLPALFPELDLATQTNSMNGTGTQQAGAAGFRWVTITAEVDANAVGNGAGGGLGTAKFTLENGLVD